MRKYVAEFIMVVGFVLCLTNHFLLGCCLFVVGLYLLAKYEVFER